MKNLTLLTCLIFGAATAQAGQSFDGAAVATGTQKTVYHMISDAHLVLEINSIYETIETTDSGNPINGTSGTCFGSVEIMGGMPSGAGGCVFSDSDGDKMSNKWVVSGFAADGALVGNWVYTGGSGKFSGISGGGSFHSLTDNATGKFRNQIGGAVFLP